MAGVVSSSKRALVLMLLISMVTIIDSQFVNTFYGTNLGSPGNFHLLLFVSFVIVASIINSSLLLFTRKKYINAKTQRTSLFRASYVATSIIQCAILLVLFVAIAEMAIFHGYHKILSLLVVYLSHFCVAGILGILSITFIQWFKTIRSFSVLVYGAVFIVVLFLLVVTIPLATEQFMDHQPNVIPPIDYIILIAHAPLPSYDTAFIFALGNYVLPLMIMFSWVLTVSMLRQYISKIGKKTFWTLVSIPLIYQLFTFAIRDANLSTDPALIDIIYSRQFQFLMGISYQISGLFFAIAFLALARKTKRKVMKNYLIISSMGMVLLFSSMQPGMPFYAAYPPFGLVTLLLLGISSHMLLVGLLGFAAYVSRDSKLRMEIHKELGVDSGLLSTIGLAEMQRQMERRLLPIAKKIKLSDAMKDHMDPSEEDVKIMIDEILKEIQNTSSNIKPDER